MKYYAHSLDGRPPEEWPVVLLVDEETRKKVDEKIGDIVPAKWR